MANVTVTWTNGRKITHVQGRESRMARFERRSTQVGNRAMLAHQCKRVCVLNENEAAQLENHGIAFPCHNAGRPHTHYSREKAETLVCAEEARWIGGGQNVMAFVRAKTWMPLPSDGMTVMQMVPGGAVY